MKVFKSLVLFLVLPLVRGSMVQLKNGGYEDIVIAINPGLPEDSSIITNIQAMVKEASTYLFNATKQRFFFKAVKIIIPLTWQPKPEYLSLKTESYDKADVIVADPFLKHGDDPYTLQYGRCGEKGQYIHFTPNFLLNDRLLKIYGSRGTKVFVHEWAHLRWGVFDEYNNDAPFYVSDNSGNTIVEATRCSANITGKYVVQNCAGDNCIRNCSYDNQTKLYEAGCTFVPDVIQNTPASIMYMQSLASVSTVISF
uniref:Calcium-activated chloride channel N-terminal domain-containing protein n=1 Tax=Pelusios castaneus TaxID=367368 RepID=A0A8C8R9S1_9SAUR